MSDITRTVPDVAGYAGEAGPFPALRVSTMAKELVGSEVLRIAGEIRALVAAGRPVCDLTVGDFSPRHFPIPDRLREGITQALDRGETNYPPSNGVLDLRHAVRRLYARDLGLEYPVESVLIAGGARPIIYCLYRAVVDAGDAVVYPVPSWNNNHYVHLSGALGRPVFCRPEEHFMPTREQILPLLPGARLLCLNSPLNPAGTAISRELLLGIVEAVVAENEIRERRGERPLYLMYDHIYWMLTFGETRHLTPPELVPESARYTVFVDGISKAFAATGLRVGWALGPTDVIARMSAILGHVGAWAPRPEQVATVGLLDDRSARDEFGRTFRRGVESRLVLLHRGLEALGARGLPVRSIAPEGALYLTARFHPFGRRTPEGEVLRTNEQVRHYLLASAAFAGVPFQAFGAPDDDGWFRLSVGAVDEQDIAAALPRLGAALEALT
jgi:aspartate aminotransferase